ncbi:undecaprenyl-diphosphatase [Eubacterium ruminantium]|nr:undecaprenyl-diphosphatase [Eubacterium ruminantium]
MAWEAEFLNSMSNLRSPVMDKIMWFFSVIGNGGILPIALTIILLIFVKTRKIGVEAVISLLLTFIIANLIIKNAVDRARPYETYTYLESLIGKMVDSSFPSGHASNTFAVAVAILLNNRKIGIPVTIVAVIMAFSRMYNVVHYPTDVIAGILIGTVIAVAVHFIAKKIKRSRVEEA